MQKMVCYLLPLNAASDWSHLIKDVDRSPTLGSQGYTDGRVKCRKPVEEPGTVPRVRIGNFCCLID